MTDACLRSLAPTLPPNVTVTGFTAPHPAPSAIEGKLDAVLSSAACIRSIAPIAKDYDGFLVACFSHHALIDALREEVAGPVIGIMEAALYAARMVGGRVGIVATGRRSKFMHEDALRDYGLEGYSAGVVSTGLGVLELESKPREEVIERMQAAALELVNDKGADAVCLGCAGMTEMKAAVQNAVGFKVNVLDGVGIGVQFLVSLAREHIQTGKSGLYSNSSAGREARGQTWL